MQRHILINLKTLITEKILKEVREKLCINFKGTPIQMAREFSPETLEARRIWSKIVQAIK